MITLFVISAATNLKPVSDSYTLNQLLQQIEPNEEAVKFVEHPHLDAHQTLCLHSDNLCKNQMVILQFYTDTF